VFLRDKGLVELATKEVAVREVPTKRKMAFLWLSEKGKKVLELSGSVDADLLRVTPKQLECLKLLEDGKKRVSEIPEDFHLTLQNLVKRELVEKRMEEVEATHKVYGKRLVCTITERGAKAHKILKAIQAL
jgi:hypothetical protein